MAPKRPIARGLKGSKTKAKQNVTEQVDKQLEEANELLQKHETSQKETWQIGKQMKKLIDTFSNQMKKEQLADAYFIWGTAIARLASLNEDAVLAEAAADKFEEMFQLTSKEIGSIGLTLWASCLLIIATEKQDEQALTNCLHTFQAAIEAEKEEKASEESDLDREEESEESDGFETRFQYAKALKEGGDLMIFLEKKQQAKEYYQEALEVCCQLDRTYAKQQQQVDTTTSTTEKEEDDDDIHDETMTKEDLSHVRLLQALVHSALLEFKVEEKTNEDDVDSTYQLFQQAYELGNIQKAGESMDALMEMSTFVIKQYEIESKYDDPLWEQRLVQVVHLYEEILDQCEFPKALDECHRICVRKDLDLPEPEEEIVDERVPVLLNALGKVLYILASGPNELKKSPVSKKQKTIGDTKNVQMNKRQDYWTQAIEVLRTCHHFHDRFGCFLLACCFALSNFKDEQKCQTWFETTESYGLVEEIQEELHRLQAFHDTKWYQTLVQPPENITSITGINNIDVIDS